MGTEAQQESLSLRVLTVVAGNLEACLQKQIAGLEESLHAWAQAERPSQSLWTCRYRPRIIDLLP